MSITPSDILASVKASTGITFREVGTGGGCMAYEARLESGHWIVATNEALGTLAEQIEWETDNEAPLGWAVGIYEHEEDMDWFGGEPILFNLDLDAFAEDMGGVVSSALREFDTYRVRSDRA